MSNVLKKRITLSTAGQCLIIDGTLIVNSNYSLLVSLLTAKTSVLCSASQSIPGLKMNTLEAIHISLSLRYH